MRQEFKNINLIRREIMITNSAEDLFALRMTYDWLIQYANLSRVSPKTTELLKEKPEEFEMVPVPKELIRQLSLHVGIGGILPGLGLGGVSAVLPPAFFEKLSETVPHLIKPAEEIKTRVEGLEIAKQFKPLADLVIEFGKELEKGNIERVMQFIAEDYRDHDGRTKKELQDSLSNLFKISSNRRFIFANSEDMQVIGNKIVANVNGAWEAKVIEESKATLKSKFFKLEFIFTQDVKGKWAISSIKQS